MRRGARVWNWSDRHHGCHGFFDRPSLAGLRRVSPPLSFVRQRRTCLVRRIAAADLGVLKLQLIDYVSAPMTAMLPRSSRRRRPMSSAQCAGDPRRETGDRPRYRRDVGFQLGESSTDDFGFFQNGECTLQPKEPCGFDEWIAGQMPDPIRPTLICSRRRRQRA